MLPRGAGLLRWAAVAHRVAERRGTSALDGLLPLRGYWLRMAGVIILEALGYLLLASALWFVAAVGVGFVASKVP